MVTWADIKPRIHATESGGDYNALFGYQNRAGGLFDDVRVTDMTVDEALDFTNPRGPYASFVEAQVGRVATPIGAYQVVGSTLRDAKKGLGLTGRERMTEDLQDRIGEWIFSTQGAGAWEGLKKDGIMHTPRHSAFVAQAQGEQPAMPQAAPQPQGGGLLAALGIGGGAPQPDDGMSRREYLALALNSLRTNPDQNLGAAIQGRVAQRQAANKRNKTVEFLQRTNPDAAALIAAGLSPADALKMQGDARSRELSARAAQALREGNMNEAMAILAEISPTAIGQQIAAQNAPRRSELIGDGKYTVTYPDGPMGAPVVTRNEDVIQSEIELAKAERERKGLPAALAKAEDEDFQTLNSLDSLIQDIGGISEMFGYDPQTGQFGGDLQIGIGGAVLGALGGFGPTSTEGTSKVAIARNRYEQFKKRLVNESLRLNKGAQTEGDAQRALDELGDANTSAEAYAAIQDLLRINMRARENKAREIEQRRQRLDLSQPEVPEAQTLPNLGWRIIGGTEGGK